MSFAVADRTSLLVESVCEYGGSLLEKPRSIVVIATLTIFNTLLGGPVLGALSLVSTLIGHVAASLSSKHDIKWLKVMKNHDALAYLFHIVNLVFFIVLPIGTWVSAPVAMAFSGRDIRHIGMYHTDKQ